MADFGLIKYKEISELQFKLLERVRHSKQLGFKSCEVKGGGQEVAAMILMLIMAAWVINIY